MDVITYPIRDSLYLNITNRCTNQCQFCIRYKSRIFNKKYHLWLEREPTAEEIIQAIGDPSKYKQIVFCGYGEPLIRLDTVKQVAKALKSKKKKVIIRIDTNGHGNLFWGRNIVPELKGLIDIMSVSLDAERAEIYDQICLSIYGPRAYPALIDFIQESKKYIPEVEATVVDLAMIDIEACKKIAENLKVSFRIRPYYEEKYVR
ncbi:radical SAM protein [candidate division WOR-1 bacterium DG_54_3]|uniref:Radical SAM protein n=1 Tax=candidate division WOR-1 bacterium DG_54_3 TaxID=1703775 RepID=A0A0S7XNN9_UNCSA|nr:MAG: radical SAM protein [candidate division WOR-1 bacterium DG_54_3]